MISAKLSLAGQLMLAAMYPNSQAVLGMYIQLTVLSSHSKNRQKKSDLNDKW